MKLITEEIESVEFIVEERNGKKSMFIEGIFLQGDITNRNRRMYPMDTSTRKLRDMMKISFKKVVHWVNLDTQKVPQ